MPPSELAKLQMLAQTAAAESHKALAGEKTRARILRLVTNLDDVIDAEIADQESKRETPVACRAGCSSCCHRVITVSIAEVVRVADFVQTTFSETERKNLDERLYSYEREVAPSFGFGLKRLRPTCPLLVDDLCTVYEARPLACRGLNSVDAEACKIWTENPDQEVQIPQYVEQLQLANAVGSGLAGGLAKNNLVSRPQDFGRALKISLNDPDAIELWTRGAHNFEAAQIQELFVEKEPPMASPSQKRYGPKEEPTGSIDSTGLARFAYLSERGKHREGLASIPKGHPAYALAEMRLPLAYASSDEVLEWREYLIHAVREMAASKFDAREAYDGLSVFDPHPISFQQVDNRELLSEIGELICNRIAAKAAPELCVPIEGPRRPGKIRVGYIGYDLRLSSLAPWALGWLKNQDPDFSTFAINLGDVQDEISQEFKRYAGNYFHLPRRRPILEDARFIKSLKLDVAIFLDPAIRARTHQMACLRLAPVQCTAWGEPETSGLPTLDYYLSSEMMEIPEAQDHYSEKLVRLPGSGVCFLRETGAISTLERRDLGFNEGPFLLSLQTPGKFDPRWDELYAEITAKTGKPILFIDRGRQDQVVVKARMERRGVLTKYVRQLTLSDYRAVIKLADAVLDTPGWNGGITTIHALDLRTPVITLATDLRRGRQSQCFLRQAGVPQLVATSREDYVSLATQPERYRELGSAINPEGMYEDFRSAIHLNQFIHQVVGQ